jgi:phage-related protein
MGHRLSATYYFIDQRGNRPVKEFIANLPAKEQAKIFAYFHELMRQGYNLRRPMADYLCHGIYELRPKNNRIFYFFFLKDVVVFLHALRKKSDKISENDLRLCIKRKLEVETYQNLEKIEI